MSNFSPSTHRGAGGVYITNKPRQRTAEIDRDLALAVQAAAKRKAEIYTIRATGKQPSLDMEVTASIAASLVRILSSGRAREHGVSPKQRAILMRILGLETLPPIASNVPAACRVLPLKPPGR